MKENFFMDSVLDLGELTDNIKARTGGLKVDQILLAGDAEET